MEEELIQHVQRHFQDDKEIAAMMERKNWTCDIHPMKFTFKCSGFRPKTREKHVKEFLPQGWNTDSASASLEMASTIFWPSFVAIQLNLRDFASLELYHRLLSWQISGKKMPYNIPSLVKQITIDAKRRPLCFVRRGIGRGKEDPRYIGHNLEALKSARVLVSEHAKPLVVTFPWSKTALHSFLKGCDAFFTRDEPLQRDHGGS